MWLRKILFKTSVTCLVIWSIALIIFAIFNLEFSDHTIEKLFEETRFYGVPVCILLTLFGTIKPNDEVYFKVIKAISTIMISAFIFIYMVGNLFAGICDWTTTKIRYVHKLNASLTIVERDYGCGIFDNTAPTPSTFKIRKLSSFLIKVDEVRLNEIDEEIWLKVD